MSKRLKLHTSATAYTPVADPAIGIGWGGGKVPPSENLARPAGKF